MYKMNNVSNANPEEIENPDEGNYEEESNKEEVEIQKPTLFWSDWGLKDNGKTGWNYHRCPKCHNETNKIPTLLVNSDNGLFFCENCKFKGDLKLLPKSYRSKTPLPFKDRWWETSNSKANLVKWFNSQGISDETLDKVDFSSSPKKYFIEQKNRINAIAFPCYSEWNEDEENIAVDVMYMGLDTNSNGISYTNLTTRLPNGLIYPWGTETISDELLIIVNHPMDRLAYMEIGFNSIICLPGGLDPKNPNKENWQFLQLIEKKLSNVNKIVISFSDNEADIELEEEIGRRFGREKCFRVRWDDFMDSSAEYEARAIEILKNSGEGPLFDAFEEAIPFPITGLYELYDVEDKFEALYEFGMPGGVSTSYPSFDEYYTVVPGQWTLVTGIPGHGKSSLLDAILGNLARDQGWRMGVFSPENQPIERHFASLIEKISGKKFGAGKQNGLTPEEKQKWKKFLNEHFKIILPDDDQESWSVDGILKLAKVLVFRYGIKGLVIDPWNEIDHTRSGGLTETEHISASLTKIRRFAKENLVHVWIVAHPTKLEPRADGKYPVPTPYSVAGGAHWRNKADNALSVYRNVGQDDEDIVDIHIQKIRFAEVGRVGRVSLRYDKASGAYKDDIDQRARERSLAEGKNTPSDKMRVAERKNVKKMSLDILDDDSSPF